MNREALTNATMSALQKELAGSNKVKADNKADYKKQLKRLSEDYANDFMNLLLGFVTEEDLYNLLNTNDSTDEIMILEQK